MTHVETVEFEPGDPHNDQMAARARDELDKHLESVRDTLTQAAGSTTDAMTVVAVTLIENDDLYPRDRLASILAAALVRLAGYPIPEEIHTMIDSISIGTDPGCDYVITSEYASKVHAIAARDDGRQWWLMDAGSTNGTRISRPGFGDIKLSLGSPFPLRDGDVIVAGRVEIPWPIKRAPTIRVEAEAGYPMPEESA